MEREHLFVVAKLVGKTLRTQTVNGSTFVDKDNQELSETCREIIQDGWKLKSVNNAGDAGIVVLFERFSIFHRRSEFL